MGPRRWFYLMSATGAVVLLLLTVTATSIAARPGAPRVLDGNPTAVTRHPWRAELTIGDKYLCGGVLISPVVVLTAAHCLATATTPEDVVVALGRNHTFFGGVTVVASAVVIDPKFRAGRLSGDWGYVVLPHPAPAQFVPIQIAGPDESPLWAPGRRATVTGYGATSEGGAVSTTLRRVRIPILNDAACRRPVSYGDGFDPATMLCAGDPDAGKDSCQGDSGGPLIVKADDGSYRLAGVVSFGRGCAEHDFPGVYTKIAAADVSAGLVAQLNLSPATAGYPYLGSGAACRSGRLEVRLAASQHRRARLAVQTARRRLDADRDAIHDIVVHLHRPGSRGKASLKAAQASLRQVISDYRVDRLASRKAKQKVSRSRQIHQLSCP